MMGQVRDLVAIIVPVCAVVVWLVRLESANRIALREISRIERQVEIDRTTALDARRENNEMLREMRSDIKRLLERG
ncbi:MAG: hypothetical protein ACK5LJ_16830 [Paracoccus sp. (in: a-proteobacteria)]